MALWFRSWITEPGSESLGQLNDGIVGGAVDGVAEVHLGRGKTGEGVAGQRCGVDADDGFALDVADDLGDAEILRFGKRDAVAFGLVIRRVEVEERPRVVVASDALVPR